MAMDKESPPLPNRHGRSHIRTPTHVFPGGRNTLALMLTTGLFILLLSTHHPATFYRYPMPTERERRKSVSLYCPAYIYLLPPLFF